MFFISVITRIKPTVFGLVVGDEERPANVPPKDKTRLEQYKGPYLIPPAEDGRPYQPFGPECVKDAQDHASVLFSPRRQEL